MTMFPSPFGSNLLVQMPPMANFAFQPIIPLSARPINLYQPPMSPSEVELWSAVHLHSLVNAKQIARKILPGASRRENWLRDGRFIVALKRNDVPEINHRFGQGAWACLRTGLYGESVAELYAFLHQRSYRDAIYTLAKEANLVEPSGDVPSKHRLGPWSPVQNPLHQDFEAPYLPSYYPFDREFKVYINQSGHPILQVIRWRGADGQTIRLYRSLLYHRVRHEYHWAEILPLPPYPIFNVNMIPARPTHPVVLVPDEFTADQLSQVQYKNAFITVPNGLKNLEKTDLVPLRGREVLVILGRQDFEEGHRIHHALKAAGVTDAWYSVDEGKKFKPFAELENIAAQKGVVLLPPSAKSILALPAQIVVEAGEPLPGGDQVRPPMIYPIIRPGDLVWLLAEPKIGKTRIMLALACGAERGNCEVGRLRITDPVGVLYVDGEMQPDDLQRAIAMVMAGAGDETGPAPFAIICAKAQPDGVVDITSPEWQATIEKALRC